MNFTVKVSLDHEGEVPQAGVQEDGRHHRTADNDLNGFNVNNKCYDNFSKKARLIYKH